MPSPTSDQSDVDAGAGVGAGGFHNSCTVSMFWSLLHSSRILWRRFPSSRTLATSFQGSQPWRQWLMTSRSSIHILMPLFEKVWNV